MGWIDRLFGRSDPAQPHIDVASAERPAVALAEYQGYDVTTGYINKSITHTGCLRGYDYDELLKHKQDFNCLVKIFKLSDYYTDADEIIRGIIKEAYLPFACAEKWKLIGADEQIKSRYEAYYKRVDLAAFEHSWFLQYFKYANVYSYLMPSGRLITLPVH